MHGELRHLHLHARLAEGMGIPKKRIFQIKNGDVLEISPESCRVLTQVPSSYIFVDGSGVGDVGPKVLHERDALARGGFVVAIIPLKKGTRELAGKPQLVTRGAVYTVQAEEMMLKAQELLEKTIKKNKNKKRQAMLVSVQQALSRYFYQTTRRNPVIVPVVQEVNC